VTDVRSLAIAGVAVAELDEHPDERGSLTELYRRSWFPGSPEMVQANLSISRAGVLRGLHYHLRQTDYWVLLEGTAFVGLVDLRPGSASRDRSEHLRLDGTLGPRGLLIPPGVAHGFYAETPIRLGYLVDLPFDGSDEHGIAWDDPDAAIPWPSGEPIVSERDRSNPSLAEARASVPDPEPSPPGATHLG